METESLTRANLFNLNITYTLEYIGKGKECLQEKFY